MSLKSRIAALACALIGASVVLSGATVSAAPPVKVEGCELIVELPGGKTVAVPICQNGPPIQ